MLVPVLSTIALHNASTPILKAQHLGPGGPVEIDFSDRVDYFRRFKLPPLRRMTANEARSRLEPLQVLKRFHALHLDDRDLFIPESRWKAIYNASLKGPDRDAVGIETARFSGTKVSQLNQFLRESGARVVRVTSKELDADETLRVPSRTTLEGERTLLVARSPVIAAIEVRDGAGVRVANFEIKGQYRAGIVVKNGSSIVLDGNRIHDIGGRGIVVMGKVADLVLSNNQVCSNGRGGIYLRGNIGPGVIEGNRVEDNRGTSNWMAGVVLSAVPVKDLDDPEDGFFPGSHFPLPARVQDRLEAPHDLVVRRNLVEDNNSSGIYCDGSYLVALIDNSIMNNDKEGVCLDYGTLASFLRGNRISGNGARSRQTDGDLAADFVLRCGRMGDGSSKAKLPGISLDNAAYNVICGNTLAGNYGGGIKVVRTGVRNLIGHNLITDNNRGQNDAFHFFAIELGNAPADSHSDDLDFAPDSENIVFRNTIDGNHYAGIFLAEGCYLNDIFDNGIFGVKMFSIESLTRLENPTLNNISNVRSRGLPLSRPLPIRVPGMVP